jgi:serine/threonine-protein kinase
VAVNTTVLVEINVGPKSALIPTGLIGQDKDQVKKTLNDANFPNVKLVPATTESVEDEKDAVLTVDPAEGESAALDADITVTYATGSSPVPVLTGRVRQQAESDAEAAGFKVRFVTRESDQAEGIVIAQDPEAGSKESRGTRITLTVATPKPAPTPPTTPAPPPPVTTPPPAASTTPAPPPGATPTATQPG